MTLSKEIINDSKTTLVDVRNVEELAENNIPFAVHIPLSLIPLNVDRFREMDGPIVLFCRSGGLSQQAMAFLKQQGIEAVHNGGGIEDVKLQLN